MGPADGSCVPASCSGSSSLANDHTPETGEAGALQSWGEAGGQEVLPGRKVEGIRKVTK